MVPPRRRRGGSNATAAAEFVLQLVLLSGGIADGATVQAGQASGPPSPPPPCETDWDCSLNGECDGGTCRCDPAWTGANCELLHLLPASLEAGPGFHGPGHGHDGTSSWGGSVVHDARTSTWHMWASEFVGGCGLSSWGVNSQIVHAVAAAPGGPYSKVGVAVERWAHNLAVAQTADGSYHLWHIGGTGAPAPPQRNCSPAEGLGAGLAMGWVKRSSPPSGPKGTGPGSPGLASNTSHVVHSAHTLDGPWQPTVTWISINAGHLSNENASPLVLPNGSVALLVNTEAGDNANTVLSMSEHGWQGPYTVPLWRNNSNGTIRGHAEDGFIYRDQRGHWHALFHWFPRIGGHAYSVDGREWTNVTSAYNGTIALTGPGVGANISCARRERPSLIFGPDGAPTHLVTGCCVHPCNETIGADYSFTSVQPLNTA